MKNYQICFCAIVVASVIFQGLKARAIPPAAVATFDNYPEGTLGLSFIEPSTGIFFTDGFYASTPGVFNVEFGSYDPPYNFPMFPGNYLTVGASSPGPGAALGGRARFTATFPVPTTSMEMDVLYSSSDG